MKPNTNIKKSFTSSRKYRIGDIYLDTRPKPGSVFVGQDPISNQFSLYRILHNGKVWISRKMFSSFEEAQHYGKQWEYDSVSGRWVFIPSVYVPILQQHDVSSNDMDF